MGVTAVQVRGPFRGARGYDHHVREFVRELDRAGVAIELIELTEWGPPDLAPEQRDPWFETLTQPVGARISLQFCMPHQLIHHRDMIDINFTMFEATGIPPDWVEISRCCDWTVLPTESSRRAWIASGVPAERLRLCPLGIRASLFGREHEPMPIEMQTARPFASYGKRFLNVSAWNERKNFFGLLRTWLQATKATDDTALVIKLDTLEPDNRVIMQRYIDHFAREMGKPWAEAAPLHLMYDRYSDEEMPRLFAAATHYISMSHGEGWDLPMMEAIGSSLTPIAPDHSAYQAYLSPSVAHLIPSEEVPAFLPNSGVHGTLFNGLNWWKPDEHAAAGIIRDILDHDAHPPASARDRILGEYSWERSTRQLLDILDEAVAFTPFD